MWESIPGDDHHYHIPGKIGHTSTAKRVIKLFAYHIGVGGGVHNDWRNAFLGIGGSDKEVRRNLRSWRPLRLPQIIIIIIWTLWALLVIITIIILLRCRVGHSLLIIFYLNPWAGSDHWHYCPEEYNHRHRQFNRLIWLLFEVVITVADKEQLCT